MYMTFRWYGKDDPVKIDYIRQIPGMKGIVSAIYDIPVGEVWPLDRILELKKEVEDAGLELSVIESVPVHEDIKLGLPTRDKYIENYNETIRNLSKAGIKTICYNFMPVFDWTRSDLEYRLADGSTCLIYDEKDIAKMDPKLGELELPGWDTSYGEGRLGALLDKYKNIDEEKLWENLERFLNLYDSKYNGLTLCTGSLGCTKTNDIVKMIKYFGGERNRIHFAHLRNVLITGDSSFNEVAHLSDAGSLDFYEIMKTYCDYGFDGPYRPDHGRMIWGETGRPGYGLYDRALAAVYLNGLKEAINKGK